MDTAQKVVMALLILAILFSIASIVLNLSLFNVDSIQLSPQKIFIHEIRDKVKLTDGGGVGIDITNPGVANGK
jgi:hypothetical protein